MAELTSKFKRGAEDLTRRAGEAPADVEKTTGGVAGQSLGVRRELGDTVREAAIEVLKPVMKKATLSAARYAVTKGPDLVKGRLEDAGGAGALAKGLASKGGGVAGAVGGAASKLTGGGGKKEQEEAPSGHGRGRRLPVQEYVDVGVDLETAYDQFTQFADWPKFMHRVERIEQRDEATLMWHENIWGVRRSWEAEILEQEPCERLVWRSKGGTQTIGVVTFHKLSDNLTRIAITMDFQPKGLFEKAASGTRISRRALRSDLMRFKAFIELRDEATGQWRGRIQEGELVEEEGEDQEEPRAEEEEERDEDEERDEPRAAEDEEEEDEDEERDEPRASEEEEDEEDYEDEEDEEPRGEEEDEEPRGEEEDEEPRAEEDEDLEEDEEEAPRSQRRGRFSRDEDEEPAAEEEEEERPRRRSRRRATAPSGEGS